MEKADLIGLVAQWMLDEQAVYLRAASELDIQPTMPQEYWRPTGVAKGNLELATRPVTPLAVQRLGPWVHVRAEKIGLPEPPVEALLDTFGELCRVWSDALASDLPTFVAMRLLQPSLGNYLEGLSSLADFDADAATRAADDLVSFLESQTFDVVQRLAIGGLDSPVPLSTGEFTFRPLTIDEQSDLATLRLRPIATRSGFAREFEATHEGHLIEHRRTVSALVEPERLTDDIPRLVLALQLLGLEPHGEGILTSTIASPIHRGTVLYRRVRVPRRGAEFELKQPQFDEARQLALKLPNPDQPTTAREVSYARFSQGVADTSAADALVDYAVALEALFLRGGKDQGELRMRLRTIGCRYIGEEPEQRKTLFKSLGDVYDERSAVVHGRPTNEKEMKEVRQQAREVTASALLIAARNGWPSDEELTALLYR